MNSPKQEMVPCTKCDGYGYDGVDESGHPYTCYHCCETGWITKAAADQEARDVAAYEAEKAIEVAARRKALGVPEGYGYYIDEYEGTVVLITPRGRHQAMVAVDDDIPF